MDLRANAAVAKAKREGRLKQKPCVVCGSEKSEAHHPDYSKPLKVVWLCRKHHSDEHAEDRAKLRAQRPKRENGRMVQVRMPTALYGQITKAAEADGRSVSDHIRRVLTRHGTTMPLDTLLAPEAVRVAQAVKSQPSSVIGGPAPCRICGKIGQHAPACPSRPPLIRSEAPEG